MANTCVMCGDTTELPEGTHVCMACQQTAPAQLCQNCSSHLRLMYSNQSIYGDNLVVNRLFHCETCHCDWEQTSTYTLKHSEMKRKFWG